MIFHFLEVYYFCGNNYLLVLYFKKIQNKLEKEISSQKILLKTHIIFFLSNFIEQSYRIIVKKKKKITFD